MGPPKSLIRPCLKVVMLHLLLYGDSGEDIISGTAECTVIGQLME